MFFYQLLHVQHGCSSTQSWGSVLPSIVRRETRIPGVTPFSFRIGIWDPFVHRGQKSYTPTAFGKLWTTPGVRCIIHASSLSMTHILIAIHTGHWRSTEVKWSLLWIDCVPDPLTTLCSCHQQVTLYLPYSGAPLLLTSPFIYSYPISAPHRSLLGESHHV